MTDAKSDKGARERLVSRAKGLKTRWDNTHAGRTVARYGENSGNVLTGGIAYFSLTSIAAMLVIGVTIASYVIGPDSEVRDAVYEYLEGAVPGIVSSGGEGNGLVEQGDVTAESISGIVGLVAFLVLFFTATRFLGGLRQGVRVMLGREAGSPLSGKMRDLLALVGIGLLVLLGAVLQVMASRAAGFFANLLADDPISEWLLRGPALAVTLLADMLFVLVAIKVLGRSPRSLRDLAPVLFWAAVVIGALRLGSSFIIGSATENPVLAPFAAVITVLIFVDFVARVVLFAAAWLGTRMDAGLQPHRGEAEGDISEAGGPPAPGSVDAP